VVDPGRIRRPLVPSRYGARLGPRLGSPPSRRARPPLPGVRRPVDRAGRPAPGPLTLHDQGLLPRPHRRKGQGGQGPLPRHLPRLRRPHPAPQRQGRRLRVLQEPPPGRYRPESMRERVRDSMRAGKPSTGGARRRRTGHPPTRADAAEGRPRASPTATAPRRPSPTSTEHGRPLAPMRSANSPGNDVDADQWRSDVGASNRDRDLRWVLPASPARRALSGEQLLAYLALRPRGASRDALAEAFRPDEDPAARASGSAVEHQRGPHADRRRARQPARPAVCCDSPTRAFARRRTGNDVRAACPWPVNRIASARRVSSSGTVTCALGRGVVSRVAGEARPDRPAVSRTAVLQQTQARCLTLPASRCARVAWASLLPAQVAGRDVNAARRCEPRSRQWDYCR
jgi:hypothetical protein